MAADKAKAMALLMLRPKGGPKGPPGMAPGGDGDAPESPEDREDGGADDELEGCMADLKAVMTDGSPADMAAAFRAALDAAQA